MRKEDIMSKEKTLGVGMLGTGWMCKVHTHGFKTARYIFDHVANWETELIAVGGTSEEKGKAAAERFGYQKGVEGYQSIITDPRVDVFDNVTPDPMHVQPTIDAALAGKHVICEKPLAWAAEDAKRMLDAAAGAGVKHLCCFSYRFLPAVRLAYELVRNGVLGKLYHFSGRYFQDCGHDEATPIEKTWYTYTGAVQGIGSHLIDMARFMIGEIEAVNGMSRTYNKVRSSKNGPFNATADEGFFSQLSFGSDISGSFETLVVAAGKRNQLTFEIFGSKGSLRWDVQEPNFLHVFLAESANASISGYTKVCATEPNHPFMDIWWPAGHVLGWEHGHINMLAHFMDCVANGKPVSPLAATFEDGYRVALIIDAMKRSAQSGSRVFV